MKKCECGRPGVISCPKCGFTACKACAGANFTSKGSHIPNVNSVAEYKKFVQVHNGKRAILSGILTALAISLAIGLAAAIGMFIFAQ